MKDEVPPQKVRFLKVSYAHSPRVYNPRFVQFPKIRLSGKWLEDTGFYIGATVKVSYEPRKIIITPREED